MSATNGFQAFEFFPPPPVPSVPTIAVPNPHNRQPSLNRNLVASKGNILLKDHGEPIIIQLEEHSSGSESRSDSLASDCSQDPSRIPLPSSALDDQSRTPTPQPPTGAYAKEIPSSAHPYIPAESKSHSPPSASNFSTAPTLVRGDGDTSKLQSSPIALRSMFPVYNPNVPLSQQSYYPQRQQSLQSRTLPKGLYSVRAMTPSQVDIATGGVRTAPPSINGSAVELASIPDTTFSSPKELEKLWRATHGMEPSPEIGSFNLEMARLHEAIFTFGYDPLSPFYTLKTFDTNEILVSKASPRKKTAVCEILQSNIEPPERRELDGLVTLIFPRLAAMLAIDQANELAKQHQLAPTHRDEVVAAAIQRAASQEACRLVWKPEGRRYELEHPAVGRHPRNPEFVASPASPEDTWKPALHIEIAPQASESPEAISSLRPPVIFVTNPNSLPSPDPDGSNIRASALPQPDTDNQLAYLDFGSMTLHIDAYKILELMPSLFAIDSVVSAILAVAIADPAINPIMGTMDLWTASPRPAPSVFGGQSVKSYTGSVYYATLAEREEAEEEAKLMKMVHQKDIRAKSKAKPEKVKKSKKTKKVQVAEFDLEKLNHYQGGSRKGQELPVVSRGIVELLVHGLQVVVWMLTAAVQFLVWAVTHLTRAVTSEKF